MACVSTSGAGACQTTTTATSTFVIQVTTTYASTSTSTQTIVTTCKATVGETITIVPPPPSFPGPSSSSIAPMSTTPATGNSNAMSTTTFDTSKHSSLSRFSATTLTATEIEIIIQGSDGRAFATSTLVLPPAMDTVAPQGYPTPFTIVAGDDDGDWWNTWSDAEKGGLIAGCILGFLLLVTLLLCCCLRRRSTHWVQHHWSNSGYPSTTIGPP